ncbi:MAG: TonB-dependent receptor [Bacteroidales bacterium]|jgi:iron complex outermembrane receptor protein|nr:TonB-dependent receptor [Bacteroidales bacterium]
MRNFLQKMTLVVALTFFMGTAMAQGFVKGTVVDADNNETLLGASVVVEGTTTGVSTGLSGTFNFEVPAGTHTIVVQFVGFLNQEFEVNVQEGQTVDLGTIALAGSQVGLDEVSVFASLAIDRKTPVAISSISSRLIEDKLGSQEFPEILKSTPGVYATKSGGGFGDGRVNLRGFNSENVAVMINGVPVNDMENGRVYWSNWAGLSDVTRTMQVQRGLGASKVAVPSIGGTINIVSKTTDIEEGGSISTTVGNDGYQKIGATVSTGLLSNGWAATVSVAKTTGEGYVDGTEFDGYNYFLNISKNLGASHRISFTSFGAPQRHGQRQNPHLIETYRNAESGNKFNSDWGMRGGQVVHIEDNFYHKSQTSLNHYWTISDKSTLSTAFYASFGTGGGGGRGGDNALFDVRLGNFDQPMDIDNIVNTNIANGAMGAVAWQRASRNDHNWFGVLSTFNTELGEHLDFTAGLDVRTYTAQHFYEVTDLLGASYIYNDDDINNPNAVLRVGDKYNYNNDGNVGWQGLFTQVEYDKNNLAAFVSASFSNTSYQRVDYFQYLDSDPMQTTDKYNFGGFSIKSGANYNLTDNHNVFANIGYFEKAAGFDAVFQGYDNEHINLEAVNQKIFSVELGYGFRGEKLAANLNVYNTKWNDRTVTRYSNIGGIAYFANLIGVNALHQGVELDFTYKVSKKLSTMGMLSVGDWRWDNNIENVQIYNEDQEPIGSPFNLFIEDVKVSNAAQTTAAVGFNYQVMPQTNFTVDFNYFADLYADYSPDSRTEPDLAQPWKIPAFSTVDASIRYGFDFGGFDAVLIARMNNVFDTEYIADARDGSASNAATALVWYGFGRTFNVSAKINF